MKLKEIKERVEKALEIIEAQEKVVEAAIEEDMYAGTAKILSEDILYLLKIFERQLATCILGEKINAWQPTFDAREKMFEALTELDKESQILTPPHNKEK